MWQTTVAVHDQPMQSAEEGRILIEIRAFLLELIARPARLRVNREFFQKDYDRLAVILEQLVEIRQGRGNHVWPDRVSRIYNWALTFALVSQAEQRDDHVLKVNANGEEWLKMTPREQFGYMADRLRRYNGATHYGPGFDDSFFLGTSFSVWVGKETSIPEHRREQRDAFRGAVHKTFRALPHGVFVRLADFVEDAVDGKHNPLLMGQGLANVAIIDRYRKVAHKDAVIKQAGREMLEQVIFGRLVPFGALRYGRNDAEEDLICRTSRLDIYFGVKPAKKELEQEEEEPSISRVVVQPDFSVILIGRDPGPAADLLPFCERAGGRLDQGSLMLRITRDSVLRARTDGLAGKEILDRLQHHSSTPLPANVLEEVRGWCALVAEVHYSTAILIYCTDTAHANRVMQALGKHGERITPTLVAVAGSRLSKPIQTRLREQGLVPLNGRPAKLPQSRADKRK